MYVSKYCILHDAAMHCVAYTTEQQIYGLAAFGNNIIRYSQIHTRYSQILSNVIRIINSMQL